MRRMWMLALLAVFAAPHPVGAQPLVRLAGPPHIDSPANGTTVRTVQLTGTTDAGTRVVVTEGANTFGPVTPDDGIHWELTPDPQPADGRLTYSAHTVDADGNTVSAESTPITVTVDTTPPNVPTITTPAEGETVSAIRLIGAADPQSVVVVSENGEERGRVTADGTGAWALDVSEQTDGAHTFTAHAEDSFGNASGDVTRTVILDTQPPETTIASGPDGPTNASAVSFTLSASEVATFSCTLIEPGGRRGPADCSSPVSYADLPEGGYTLSVVATDRFAHADPTPATRAFTVDRTAPAAPIVSGSPGALAFATDDPGASFECSVDGGAPAPCAASYSTLPPGNHTLGVNAVDRAGNRGPLTRYDFAIAAAAPPTQPTVAPAPTPVFHDTVVVRPAAGHVFVRRPGSAKFVEVTRSVSIPLGSTLDTKKGAITLLSVPRKGGRAQKAVFNGGIFRVTQPKAVTVLTLTEALRPCGRKASAAKRKPKTRRLWGSGSGAFSTHGRYSAATIRGTRWLVQDSCAGTVTRVLEGVVTVRDNARHRTVLLRAGKRYLARPHH